MFDAVMEDARKLEPEIEVVTIPEHSALRTEHYFRQSDYALIIAPEFDGILERLACEALEAGCKLLGPLPDAIRLTADKWELYQHWERLGVPTPQTWLPMQLPTEERSYVKKHRYGAGSLGVEWWQPGDEIDDQHIVQRFVSGIPVSVALLISPSGKITPLLPADQLISDDGKFSYQGGAFITEPPLCKRVLELVLAAVQDIAGLQGYVGVDGILGSQENGSEDVVLEVNPRLTTSYLGLRQAASSNLIQCMVEVVDRDTRVPIKWSPCGINWSSQGSS